MEENSRVQNACERMQCSKTTKPTCHTWAWSIAVVVAFVAQVVMNILASEDFGSFGGSSNAQVSNEHPTFLTPDGLTFSVWSVIYTFQGLFTIYQIIPIFQNSHAGVSRARFWVVVLYVANCLWLPVFSHELFWLAFMLMLVMDVSLVMIYRMMTINYGAVDRTQGADMFLPSKVLEDKKETLDRHELEDTHQIPLPLLHPWPVKLICFVGFSTNISWLTVATMVNLLVAAGQDGWHKAFEVVKTSVNGTEATAMVTETVYVNGSEQFVVMAVCLVALIACILAIRNGDVPYALVAMWALGGVHRAQSAKPAGGYPEQAMSSQISCWALAMIITIAVVVVAALAKNVVESLAARSTITAGDTATDASEHLYSEKDKQVLYADEKSGANHKDAHVDETPDV